MGRSGGEAGTSTAVPSSSTSRRTGTGASMMTNKVVFRHLPPTLAASEFLDIISPLPEHRYFQFCQADYSAGAAAAFCRAYIGLRRLDDVYAMCSKFDGYEFADTKGHMYPALVEFAPNQRIADRTATGTYQFLAPVDDAKADVSDRPEALLCKKPRKQNNLKATLLEDDDFKVFCDKLSSARSAFVADGAEQPGLTVEAMLKEIEDKHKEDCDFSKKRSPLVEFLDQRRKGQLAERRILAKSGAGAASGGDRRGGQSGSQKKKKRERKRERDREREKQKEKAPVGSIKIAAKPASSGKGAAETQAPVGWKGDNGRETAKKNQQREQQRKQERSAGGGRDRDGDSSRATGSARGDRSAGQYGRPSSGKQGGRSAGNRSEDSGSQRSSAAALPQGQNLKFVDTGSDDETANGASKPKSQQPSNRRSGAAASGGDRRRQNEGQSKQGGYYRNTDEDYDDRGGSASSKQRSAGSDRKPATGSSKTSKDTASTASTTPRTGSGASVGRTLVFSRSIAAAQSSVSSSSGGGSARPTRFDPRRGNAPPPAGSSKNE